MIDLQKDQPTEGGQTVLRGWDPAPLESRKLIDLLIQRGYTVGNPQGEDAELIDPRGSAVRTWQEDHP